jgi:Zn-dependent peptidase ImmA (M78 family)
MELQTIANNVCDLYKVKHIPIKTQLTKLNNGLACYVTYRVKRNGKISKTHYPKYILIGGYGKNRTPILELAHELAHHILNVKYNSLMHSGRHSELEDKIGCYIAKNQ